MQGVIEWYRLYEKKKKTRFKENRSYKERYIDNQNESVDISLTHKEERNLGNVTLIGNNKGKKSRRKHRVIYLFVWNDIIWSKETKCIWAAKSQEAVEGHDHSCPFWTGHIKEDTLIKE